MVAGMLAMFILSGQLVTRSGRYKIFPILGSAVMAVGMYLLSQLGATSSYGRAALAMFVVGLGMGLVMQVLVVVVQNAVPHSQLGTATATATFFRSIGGAFGVAVLGSVFSSRLVADLMAHASPALLGVMHGGSLAASPAQISQLPPAEREVIVVAFAHALRDVFLVAIPIAVVAFALAWLVKELPLRTRAHVTAAEPGEAVLEGMTLDVPGEFPGV